MTTDVEMDSPLAQPGEPTLEEVMTPTGTVILTCVYTWALALHSYIDVYRYTPGLWD